jgi:hypothetical protein
MSPGSFPQRAFGGGALARPSRSLLRCGRSVTPGEQLVDPSDFVVGAAAEHKPFLPPSAISAVPCDTSRQSVTGRAGQPPSADPGTACAAA